MGGCQPTHLASAHSPVTLGLCFTARLVSLGRDLGVWLRQPSWPFSACVKAACRVHGLRVAGGPCPNTAASLDPFTSFLPKLRPGVRMPAAASCWDPGCCPAFLCLSLSIAAKGLITHVSEVRGPEFSPETRTVETGT